MYMDHPDMGRMRLNTNGMLWQPDNPDTMVFDPMPSTINRWGMICPLNEWDGSIIDEYPRFDDHGVQDPSCHATAAEEIHHLVVSHCGITDRCSVYYRFDGFVATDIEVVWRSTPLFSDDSQLTDWLKFLAHELKDGEHSEWDKNTYVYYLGRVFPHPDTEPLPPGSIIKAAAKKPRKKKGKKQ